MGVMSDNNKLVFQTNFDVYIRVFCYLVFVYSVKVGIFLPTFGK